MSVVLPTSAYQGLPLAAAVRAIAALRPDSVQLCPGNQPSPGMAALLRGARVHHTFSWSERRVDVWDTAGEPCFFLGDRSVHPPDVPDVAGWLARHTAFVLEVMPPGSTLGCGEHLQLAMDLGIRLAVDVSHLYLQVRAGALSPGVLARLQEYDGIEEVHVSENDGLRDLHRPPTTDTFGVGWARARQEAGVPIVLECRLFGISVDDGRRLVDAWR